jgi:aminoglycoside 6-adenylyltransferase
MARTGHPPLDWAEAAEADIVRWCEDRDDVRAAIVTSTRALPNNATDRFSDLDVILVLTDITTLARHRDWLSDFGEVLVSWRDDEALAGHPPRTCFVTQYRDGRKIDFTLWPSELLRLITSRSALPDELDVGYRVIVDKDGMAAALSRATHRAHIPRRPSTTDFAALVESFFHEATYVAKHLSREDLLPAKYSLDHVMKQMDLRRMLEWRIEIDHDWTHRPGAYGKALKKMLPPERYRQLERTYVGPELTDNWDALFATIALFREVAMEVANALGLDYCTELDANLSAYLLHIRSESR